MRHGFAIFVFWDEVIDSSPDDAEEVHTDGLVIPSLAEDQTPFATLGAKVCPDVRVIRYTLTKG